MLSVFPSQQKNPAELADWVELHSLKTKQVITFSQLVDEFVEQDDDIAEDSDEATRSEQKQAFYGNIMSNIQTELSDRANQLKDSYPFVYCSESETFFHKKESENFQYQSYILCLFASYLKSNDLLEYNDSYLKQKTVCIRNRLFPFICCLSGIGLMDGYGHMFGYPRPDKTGFKKAFIDLLKQLKQGKVRENLSKVTTKWKYAKDAKIDLVHWRKHVNDESTHTVYFGQVGVTHNALSKYLNSRDIEKFFKYADDDDNIPCKNNYLLSAYFPYNIQHRKGYESAEHSLIMDRTRIPVYAESCLGNRIVNMCPNRISKYKTSIRTLTNDLIHKL